MEMSWSSTFLWYCLLCCEGISNFGVWRWNPKVWTFSKMTLWWISIFLCCCLLWKSGANFQICGWKSKMSAFNKSYWTKLSCEFVHYGAQSGSHVWVRGWNPLPFKPQYPHAYSPYCSPYISYGTSWENLIKCNTFHVWWSFPLLSWPVYMIN